MRTVGWTDNTLIPRMMEAVELAVRQADIEPVGHPVLVEHHASGAKIVPVVFLVLDSRENSDLLGRVMAMVDRERLRLLI